MSLMALIVMPGCLQKEEVTCAKDAVRAEFVVMKMQEVAAI
jgi:hypothetical protein